LKHSILKICGWLCLILLLALNSVRAQDVSSDTLQVLLTDDIYPYAYRTEQELPAGLLVDFWQEVANAAGMQLKLEMIEREAVLERIAQNQFQVIGGLTRTKEREKNYFLGDNLLEVYSNVFVHRELPPISRLDQLQPLVIGVLAHSSHLTVLRAKIPGVVVREFATSDELYDAAIKGEIRAFTALDRLTPRYHDYKKLIELFPLYRKLPLQKIEYTYAVTPKQPELSKRISNGLLKLPPHFLDKLQRRWLSGVSNEDTLLVSLSVGNPPLMNVSLNGAPQGLLVDLWQLWSDVTGTPVAFIPDSSSDGLKSLQLGRVDLHMGYPVNAQLPEETMAAYDVYKVTSSFYFHKVNPLQRLDDSPLPIGIFSIASYDTQLREAAPLKQIQRFDKLEDMLQALDRRKISGFYAADLIMQERVLLSHANSFAKLDNPKFDSVLKVLVQQGNERLADKVRRGFAKINQDQLEALEKKWLRDPTDGYFRQFRQQIPLTEVESAWIKANRNIKVGVVRDWAPIEFVDEQGEVRGVTADIVKLMQERTGANFQFVPYSNWQELFADFKNGELDVVAHLVETAERRQFATFTQDFWPLRWTLASHSNTPTITQVNQLAGKTIAVKKEYQIINYLNANFPKIKIIKVAKQSDGLEMLQTGEADFVIDSLFAIGSSLRQPEHINLRMHLPADMPTYPTTLAIRHDWPILLNIMDKGLRTMTEQDRQQITDRWFALEQKTVLPADRMFTIILQVVLVGGLLFMVVFFWNMSLRREVSLRRDMEEKMRFMATHDDLTKLSNRSLLQERLTQAIYQHARHQEKLALMFIDLDGFKAVNDQFGHHVGDELLVKVADILRYCVRKSDTVARFGGDEFVILLTGLIDRDDAAIVAEKILLHLAEPLQLSACTAQIGASIGIALYPDDGADEGGMLKAADGLMYLAKEAGKGHYRFRSEGQ
jgi:diguanylate cyclase (GGDEF)-like protein